MSSIFEELMNSTPSKLTESVKKRSPKKIVEGKKISCNKIRVESFKIFEEEDLDELDDKFAVDPENKESDEVVLVIDPALDSEEEIPENAAEEMVGEYVYKCPICGANYVCDCDNLEEEIEVDENGIPVECPICGDEADQILIGEIAPVNEAPGEEVAETDFVDVDDSEAAESDFSEEEEVEEACGSKKKKESFDIEVKEGSVELEIKSEDEEIAEEVEDSTLTPIIPENKEVIEEVSTCVAEPDGVELEFEEVKFESLVKSIIKENYHGTPKFEVKRIASRGTKLTLEYVVREGKKVTKGKMVGEGFNPKARKMTLEFKDQGAFTKKFSRKPSFIVECRRIKNTIIPMSINYDYKVRVNESLYRVTGKVGK